LSVHGDRRTRAPTAQWPFGVLAYGRFTMWTKLLVRSYVADATLLVAGTPQLHHEPAEGVNRIVHERLVAVWYVHSPAAGG
jgi:hypothetical protein